MNQQRARRPRRQLADRFGCSRSDTLGSSRLLRALLLSPATLGSFASCASHDLVVLLRAKSLLKPSLVRLDHFLRLKVWLECLLVFCRFGCGRARHCLALIEILPSLSASGEPFIDSVRPLLIGADLTEKARPEPCSESLCASDAASEPGQVGSSPEIPFARLLRSIYLSEFRELAQDDVACCSSRYLVVKNPAENRNGRAGSQPTATANH